MFDVDGTSMTRADGRESGEEGSKGQISSRSRRGLLLGALGGLGAWAATAVGRANPVRAGADGDVILGGDNITTETTTIRYSADPNHPSVEILGPSNIGGSPIPVPLRVDGGDNGGHTIHAITKLAGTAVFAEDTFEGYAIRATSKGGFALDISGRIRFWGHEGLATIPAGRTSVTLNPSNGVYTGSHVLLTPTVDLGSRRLWYTKSSKANTVTIHISSPRTSSTRISWFMVD
jgi:hypothetical protein